MNQDERLEIERSLTPSLDQTARLLDALDAAEQRAEKAEAKTKRLAEALRWYADFNSRGYPTYSEKAREALRQHEEQK